MDNLIWITNEGEKVNDMTTATIVPDDQRIDLIEKLFGFNFPMKLEPFIFFIADRLSEDYTGGVWEFYTLSNGGFYMAPTAPGHFNVSCENGYEGTMSADAYGITCCIYAYSHLSIGDGEFTRACAKHYHLLRKFMRVHPEAEKIWRAID